ncbi:hypothetical protein ACH5RR_033846 [Cinchona calisaya]|uniref:RNase H type-1 domain-containing protein n=1 Tax=Cinchona calisaya TaxID=153742 RepID=A0ABD2YA35_9GENT
MMEKLQQAFSIKMWWSFLLWKSLWSAFLSSKYLQNSHHPLQCVSSVKDSCNWKRMLGCRDVVFQSFQYLVREGTVSFWFDDCLGTDPLLRLGDNSWLPHLNVRNAEGQNGWNEQLILAHFRLSIFTRFKDANVQKKGVYLASKCSLCEGLESLEHLFLYCPWSSQVWRKGGIALRDHQDKILVGFPHIYGHNSSMEAEARAMLDGVKRALKHLVDLLQIEVDSTFLIAVLKGQSRLPWKEHQAGDDNAVQDDIIVHGHDIEEKNTKSIIVGCTSTMASDEDVTVHVGSFAKQNHNVAKEENEVITPNRNGLIHSISDRDVNPWNILDDQLLVIRNSSVVGVFTSKEANSQPRNGMHILAENLKSLKGVHKRWNKEKFGNVSDNILRAETEVKQKEREFQDYLTHYLTSTRREALNHVKAEFL